MLEGKPRSQPDPGWDTSKVRYRALDSEVWYVHSYSDGDGSFRLVRKIPSNRILTEEDMPPTQPVFVDQFSLSEPAGKRESIGFALVRSTEVRQAVLERAAGTCECCATHGFKMDTGAVFLETHHVIPLSENGPDVKWNVIAICPNDHRRAHLGEDRAALRSRFIAHLLAIYPAAEDVFRALLDASSDEASLS